MSAGYRDRDHDREGHGMSAIRIGLVAAAAAALAAPGVGAGAGGTAREAATCSASPALTEGPYYTSGPPRRTTFVTARSAGTRLLLTGRVLDTGCRPLAGARVDFWQANARGSYDNSGYRFRGYQLTDKQGRYRLLTVVPGLYPGRTEHIHVKVTPPGGATLTTQLYFPGVTQNTGDGIFDRRLLVRLTTSTKPWRAGFTFVVAR
jgi:intradiol ring-cleaving dioxygenase-like protein